MLILAASGVLLTSCNRPGTDVRQQLAGTWFQGRHTLTLAPDGSYTSVFPGEPAIIYMARWHIDGDFLVVTDVKSNSVPIAGDTTVKIVLVDRFHLEMALGTNRISMLRGGVNTER